MHLKYINVLTLKYTNTVVSSLAHNFWKFKNGDQYFEKVSDSYWIENKDGINIYAFKFINESLSEVVLFPLDRDYYIILKLDGAYFQYPNDYRYKFNDGTWTTRGKL